jgi:hypothetical protein
MVASALFNIHPKIIEESHFESTCTLKMRTHPEFSDRSFIPGCQGLPQVADTNTPQRMDAVGEY